MATGYIQFGRNMSVPIEGVRLMRDQQMGEARRLSSPGYGGYDLKACQIACVREARRLNRLIVQARHEDYVAAY